MILDEEVERKEIDDQEATMSWCPTNWIKEDRIEFQLELENRFETLQEVADINTMSGAITDMMQQSASREAKAIHKPQKSRISS